MKNKMIILVVIQLFVFSGIGAQNLGKLLGGINTNFQIYSDTIDLKVSDQLIILKAEKKTHEDSNFGTGWAYGYQSFHLEFITSRDIRVQKYPYKSTRSNEPRLDLVFTDSSNNILATKSIPFEYVDVFNNASIVYSPFFYSIDLIDIPIVLLDKTVKINMIKKVASKDL